MRKAPARELAGVFFCGVPIDTVSFSAYTMPMTKNGSAMLLRHAIGEILREERLAQGVSMRTVSQQAFISLGFLSEVETGKKEIASEFLDQVIRLGLGLEPHEVIMRAALRMAGIDIPDTPESLYEVIDEYADLG